MAVPGRQSSVAQSPAPSPQSPVPSRDLPDTLARRVIVEQIRPQIDSGRFPIKRTVGESVTVTATIFADGHDVIGAVLRDRYIPTDVVQAFRPAGTADLKVRTT